MLQTMVLSLDHLWQDSFSILHMLLDPCFDMLLCVANILFSSCKATGLVDDYWVSALAIVQTILLILAVAWKYFELLGDNMFQNFWI